MSPDTVAVLMSWAASLSGYAMPDAPPEVRFVPHSFFVDTMCGGVECNVLGGYLDADAPNTIFIDEKFADDTSLYVYSYIVHEAVHLAQYHSGEFDSLDCDDSLQRERQAYFVQNEFLIQNGHPPILRMVNAVCAKP